MGGGGDTVTNTGLGDEQYDTLSANQAQMSSDMAAQQAANEAALADQNAAMQAQIDAANASAAASASAASAASAANSGRFDRLDTSVSGVNTNVTTGFASIEDLLGQYNTASEQQFNNLNAGQTAGFKEMGGRFDTVDRSNENIQSSVDQGFVDQAQGFSDAQVNRTANAAANTADFAAAGEAMNKGFTDTSNQMTQTQANVLGGQGEIKTDLDTMSNTADTYALQSLQNQIALQEGQDGFVSSFDTYTNRYGEDQRLASQARNDLLRAQTNQTDSLRSDIGNYAQAAASGQGEITQQVKSLEKSAGNPSEVAQQVANLDKQFAQGLAGLDANQITQARDMAKIASGQSDLSMDMRQNFNQLARAFDDNGKLIQNSIDQQGNTTLRSVDEMGNLLLQSYDTFGTNVGNNMINLRESLQQLSDLQQGANGQMGNLSPAAPAVASGGFASPYTMTG